MKRIEISNKAFSDMIRAYPGESKQALKPIDTNFGKSVEVHTEIIKIMDNVIKNNPEMDSYSDFITLSAEKKLKSLIHDSNIIIWKK